ncbi:FecR domain-containing protein, partial [Pseudomonas urmiensis]|uniref:FecR domain-containing protein n=2 Tax=Pseudomonas TaxID=286 RepID=UPI0034D51B8C
MPTPERIPAQAQVDQAIDWLVKLRFDEPSARTERQFQQWLASHPHNALAWQRVRTLSDELAGLPSDLSRRTLEGSRRQQISRRDHLKLLAVLAVGGSLAWAAREPLGLPALLADSSTATGERRDVQGSDGSRIQLNTASAIDLRYSADQRLLTLIRGELTLDSNANDKRPFIIATQLGALSTHDGQLLLRENAQGLLLAVRRGEVTLMPNSAPLRQVHPGEVLQLAASGAI